MARELHCVECTNYLSVFPIYSYDYGKSVCGRCEVDESRKPQRQDAYEIVARFLNFPCRYKTNGCLEEMTPSELATHEKFCQHRTFTCIQTCFWQGASYEILPHFRQEHPELEYKEGTHILIDLTTVQQTQFLLQAMNRVFMIHVRLVNQKLLGFVTLIGPENEAKQYLFGLSLDDNVPSEQLEVHPETKELNSFTVFQLDVGNASCIRLQASVVKNRMYLPTTKKDVKSILQTMDCPVCFNILLPPIWQCRNGHCLCNVCNLKLKHCPTCRIQLENIKNLMLEHIYDEMEYSCEIDGCSKMSKGLTAKENHEKSCIFVQCQCPFCAAKLNYALLVSHINNEHQPHITTNHDITVNVDTVKSLIWLVRHDCLFLFRHNVAKQSVSMDVVRYGPPVEDNKFDYIVTVKKGPRSKAKLEFRLPCSPMSGLGAPVSINKSVLKSLKENNDMTYEYHIDIVQSDKDLMNIKQLTNVLIA